MRQFYILLILLFTLSCSLNETKEEKSRKENKGIKIEIFRILPSHIYDLNHQLIKQKNSPNLEKSLIIFKAFDDTLQVMKNELIAAAGGFTRKGYYYNAPAYKQVNDYFYGETDYRNNSHTFFFTTLENFQNAVKQLNPGLELVKDINYKFNILQKHYNLKNKADLFKELSIDEAVALLDDCRRQVALVEYEYLVNLK